MSTLCNILGGDRYFVKMIKARVEEKGLVLLGSGIQRSWYI